MRVKVVSGGQTGVDRAALDAAVALDLAYAGWVPRGGWAEDRPDPPGLLADYPGLKPTPSSDPLERTEWNVRDSARTLILVGTGGLAASPGTAQTLAFAERLGRPCRVFDVDAAGAGHRIAAWLSAMADNEGLNVAGPRESETPGIYIKAKSLLISVLQLVSTTSR